MSVWSEPTTVSYLWGMTTGSSILLVDCIVTHVRRRIRTWRASRTEQPPAPAPDPSAFGARPFGDGPFGRTPEPHTTEVRPWPVRAADDQAWRHLSSGAYTMQRPPAA